jgi:hypothetical protein
LATIAPNGAAPAVAIDESPIERLIREIEDVLAPLDARREQLEAELFDLNEERERLNAGIAGLSGRLPAAQPEKKKSGPKPSADSRQAGKGQHDPSQKIVDDVFATVLARTREGEDITCNEISDTLGLAKSTVLRGIAILRETERIRIVGTRKAADDGRVGGRGANAYTVMPS